MEDQNEALIDAASSTPVNQCELRPLTTSFMIRANAFWLGYQFYWFIMSVVVVPKQIEEIVGDQNKGSGLAAISIVAGALNLILAVVYGALNDRHASKLGKRRVSIVVGTVILSASLLLLSGTYSLWFYGFGYVCMTLSAIIASVPFNGLIADITPPEQKGAMSAVMGSMSLAGSLLGAIAGACFEQLGISGMYLLLMATLTATCHITVTSVRENSSMHLAAAPPLRWRVLARELVAPLVASRDFRLVFASRLLFQLGIATVTQFLQYWIGDCVLDAPLPPEQAVSVALIPLLVLAPVAAAAVPLTRRKAVVYASAAAMMVTCVVLEVATGFAMAVVAGGVFGLGYGPFVAAEFAMLMDVLPSERDAAKDMALWHSAMVLPQIFATPLAGWVLDYYQRVGIAMQPPSECLGYKVTFGVCVAYFAAGCEATRRIGAVK